MNTMQKKYFIRDLEDTTGIKAHTIRMWEKRYNLITPERTDTNIRYYSEKTFKKFLLIAQLYHNNFKISEIAKFSNKELQEKALLLNKTDKNYEAWEAELLQSVMNFDNDTFQNTLRDCVFSFDFNKTFVFLLMPFLHKIDIFWKAETLTILHRNFAFQNSIYFLFNAHFAISKYIKAEQKKFALFTDNNDFNILTMLFAETVLKKNSFQTFFFRNINSYEQFFGNIDLIKAKNIIAIVPETNDKTDILLNFIKKHKQRIFYLIDTNYKIDVDAQNIVIINNLEELEDEIF